MGEKLDFSAGYVYILFNENKKEKLRLGIIAKRNLGKAVLRNKAKRKIREAIRLLVKEEKEITSFDIIFVLRRLDFQVVALKEEIKKILKGLNKPNPNERGLS